MCVRVLVCSCVCASVRACSWVCGSRQTDVCLLCILTCADRTCSNGAMVNLPSSPVDVVAGC